MTIQLWLRECKYTLHYSTKDEGVTNPSKSTRQIITEWNSLLFPSHPQFNNTPYGFIYDKY